MLKPKTLSPRSQLGQGLARLQQDSLLRNSLYLMATTVSTSLLGYVYWTFLARNFNPAAVGLTSALIGLVTLSAGLANLGLGSVLIQTLPRSESPARWSLTLNTALLIGGVVGVLTGLVLGELLPVLLPQLAGSDEGFWLRIAAGLAVPLWTLSTLLDSAFTASRANGNVLGRNLIFSVLKLLAVLGIGSAGWATTGIFGSWLVALGLALAAAFWLLKRLHPAYGPAVRGWSGRAGEILSPSIWHHFINLGSLAPMYLLPTVVTLRLSATANGYFYITWMLAGFFFMVSPSVATALFAEGSGATRPLKARVRTSFLLITGLLGPAMLVFLLQGQTLLGIFGPEYPQQGLTLLILLTLSAVPDAITNVYLSVLKVHKRLVEAACLNLLMAGLALGLSWVLVPTLGITGVGWAWLTAQVAGCGWLSLSLVIRKQVVYSEVK